MIYFWFTFGYNLNTCRKYFRHWNNSGLFPCCHSVLCAGQWEIKIYFHCLTENNEVHLSGFSYVMREMFTLDRSLTPPKCAMMKSVGTQKQHILWQECLRNIRVRYDKSLLEWIKLVSRKYSLNQHSPVGRPGFSCFMTSRVLPTIRACHSPTQTMTAVSVKIHEHNRGQVLSSCEGPWLWGSWRALSWFTPADGPNLKVSRRCIFLQ